MSEAARLKVFNQMQLAPSMGIRASLLRGECASFHVVLRCACHRQASHVLVMAAFLAETKRYIFGSGHGPVYAWQIAELQRRTLIAQGSHHHLMLVKLTRDLLVIDAQ